MKVRFAGDDRPAPRSVKVVAPTLSKRSPVPDWVGRAEYDAALAKRDQPRSTPDVVPVDDMRLAFELRKWARHAVRDGRRFIRLSPETALKCADAILSQRPAFFGTDDQGTD